MCFCFASYCVFNFASYAALPGRGRCLITLLECQWNLPSPSTMSAPAMRGSRGSKPNISLPAPAQKGSRGPRPTNPESPSKGGRGEATAPEMASTDIIWLENQLRVLMTQMGTQVLIN